MGLTSILPAKSSSRRRTIKIERVSHSNGRGGKLIMKLRFRKATTATTLLVTLAVTLVYVGASFAEPNSGLRRLQPVSPQLLGVLTTQNNKAITLNNASAKSGATVPSGSTIETPDGVGATIHLGALGSIC